MEFSFFFFGDESGAKSGARYGLLLESARFADRSGFAAVWTPERHFHPFGGDFPNPAVTGAAVAAVTKRIGIRAGSVVAPLHHVLRIAEEWSVVDGISEGRAGVSLASGWNPADFVLRPDMYEDRGRSVVESVHTLRGLWRGEPYPIQGRTEELKVFPATVRGEIPLWLTTSGNPETYRSAARAGVGVLTHLAQQTLPELTARIGEYRREFVACGHLGRPHVVLMLHTYLADEREAVEARVREPLQRYLASAMELFHSPGSEGGVLSPARALMAVRPAVQRYLRGEAGLFGSVDEAEERVRTFQKAGVDEIACLIDFGVAKDLVLAGLEELAKLRLRFATV
jgi:natural product biosynthesis luciferase-like monooxygenase protein